MKVKIEGIEDITRELGKLPELSRVAAERRILRKALTPMKERAKNLTPVRYGHLVSAWKVKTKLDDQKQPIGYVTNTNFVSLFIEYGHKKVARRSLLRSVARRARTVTGFVSAKPMLRPAFDSEADGAIKIFGTEMGKVISDAVKKAGK